jgi:hypothetical protein
MTMTLPRLGAAVLLACLAGCAGNTPQLDRQFGMATKTAMLQQVVTPVPPASQTLPTLDGQAAKSAYDNYQKSFKEPTVQTGALVIGVGR